MKIYIASLLGLLLLAGCDLEGEDASLFNNVNELIVTGRNTGQYVFDPEATLMLVHLHTDPLLAGTPSARLSLSWHATDAQGNVVALGETQQRFINAAAPGDYYARAFIDVNRNSRLDGGEPYADWTDAAGALRVLRVREESRWRLVFSFRQRYGVEVDVGTP